MNKHSMNEFKHRVKRIIRFTIFAFGFFVLGSITPFSQFFLGLALGTLISLLNLILTAYKVNQIGEVAVNKNIHTAKKPVFSGMLTRFITSILAVMIALKYPQYISLVSTLIGLFVTQIITVVDGIKNNF